MVLQSDWDIGKLTPYRKRQVSNQSRNLKGINVQCVDWLIIQIGFEGQAI